MARKFYHFLGFHRAASAVLVMLLSTIYSCGSQRVQNHRSGTPFSGLNSGTSNSSSQSSKSSGSAPGPIASLGAVSAIAANCEIAVEAEFKSTTWKTAFSTCSGCHVAGGVYNASGKSLFVFPDGVGSTNDFLAAFSVAQTDLSGQPLFLAKAQGQASHGGGLVFASTSAPFSSLSLFISDARAAQVCILNNGAGIASTTSSTNFDSGLSLLSPSATINKAAVQLLGRYGSSSELAAATSDINSIDPIVTTMMNDPKFYDQAMSWFNDYWFVSSVGFRHSRNAIIQGMIPTADYNQYFTYPITNPKTGVLDYWGNYSDYGIESVAREPLQMVAHLLQNDRPFTEILTAKYRLVNRPLAKILKIDEATLGFKLSATDISEWVEAQSPLVNVQYAGILTTQSFLTTYGNTGTNRYRHMAKNVLKLFTNFDVMAISGRVDLSSVNMAAYPWHNNAQCTGCHRYIDPVAGWFAMESNCSVNFVPMYFRGPYGTWQDGCHTTGDSVFNGWFNSTDMFSPATNPASIDASVPSTGIIAPADYSHALEIGAASLVKSDGFAVAITTQVFTKVTRYKDPTTNPEFTDPNVLASANSNYKSTIRNLANSFIQSNFNLKKLIIGIMKTPYFRAQDAVAANPLYAGIGPKLLPPEITKVKINAAFGLPWGAWGGLLLDDASSDYGFSLNGNNLDSEGYQVFAGGIDAANIKTRLDGAGAVSLSVYKNMAYQMSCFRTAADFGKSNRSTRLLFPYVDGTTDIAAAANKAAVMQNVQYLYSRIIGQTLPADDPEIVAAYNFLMDVYTTGQAGVKAGTISANPNYVCDGTFDYVTANPTTGVTTFSSDSSYSVRAWQGLIAYLLRSYQFLYMPT